MSVSWCQVRETVRAAVVSEHLRCKRDFIIRTTSACSATRQITTATRAISLGAFAGVGSGRQIICKRQAHRPRDVRPVPYGPRRRMTAASRWHHRTGCRSCWVRTPTSRGDPVATEPKVRFGRNPWLGVYWPLIAARVNTVLTLPTRRTGDGHSLAHQTVIFCIQCIGPQGVAARPSSGRGPAARSRRFRPFERLRSSCPATCRRPMFAPIVAC